MAKRIQVRLILQLHNSGMSQNDIASSRHISKSSISKVLAVAREKNITYADIQGMDDAAVYKMFFAAPLSSLSNFNSYKIRQQIFPAGKKARNSP